MPQGFDAAQIAAGRVPPAYTPISSRLAGNGGGGLLPGSHGTAVPQNGNDPVAATAAPPTAAAAPSGNTTELFTGLAEALNTHQQQLANPRDPNRKYDVADVYEIEFAPATLKGSKLKKPGSTDITKTATQDISTAQDKLNPSTDSVNMNSQAWQVTAGTQIVQLIDQIMKSSAYISDQQLSTVDPTTGKTIPSVANPNGVTTWYKISVQATQLGYDAKRHDHAYKMKFLITPYALTQAMSEYFPDSRYRGSHKSYNYWFTGLNTQILHFEQEFNNLYRLIISGIGKDYKKSGLVIDSRDQAVRTYMPTSTESSQGANGYVNEGAANLAGFLYSPSDQGKIKLKIIGDPAWMQQGEVSTGVSAKTFSFAPFNNDGTINYESQEIVFDVSWNQPVDYNMDTGIMNVNARNTQSGKPQQNATYTAIKCKNTFSKGRFEQDLEGRLLIEYSKNTTAATVAAANGRPVIPATSAAPPKSIIPGATLAAGSRNTTNSSISAADEANPDLWNDGTAATDAETQIGPPAPLPAPAPEVPSSDGVDVSNPINAGDVQIAGSDNSDQFNQFMDREA